MLRCERQARHEDEEVKQAAEDDGGGLFEEAREHKQWPVAGCRLSATNILPIPALFK